MTWRCAYNIAVDRPDETRKRHGRPTPRVGGVPIAIAYISALAIVYLMAPAGHKLYIQHQDLLLSLLPATAIVFVTGLVDDIFTLKPLGQADRSARRRRRRGGARHTLHHHQLPLLFTSPHPVHAVGGVSDEFHLADRMHERGEPD